MFNYNGILDAPGDNIIDDLDNGIVVGVTPSDLQFLDSDPGTIPSDPVPVNLNQGPFTFGSTVYERWCFDEANSCGVDGFSNRVLPGPINSAFDLDFWSICYVPNEGGFSITSGFEGNTEFSCGVVTPPSGPVVVIPTMGQWGMVIASVILGFFAIIRLRRIKDLEL